MEAGEVARRCVEYIAEHPDGELSVETLAEKLSYSVPHLRRSFLRYTGYNLGYYIRLAKTERAARALIEGLRVAEAAELGGFGDYYNLSHSFSGVYGVPPSSYIGAKDLPTIKLQVPTTVAGYILRRASEHAEPGLALWHGYDFSGVDPSDFQVASPEGGAEIGVWTELGGEQCYLFGVVCREDAVIPPGMVRCALPPAVYAMFLIPETESTQELSDRIRAAMAPALAYCDAAKKYEPVPGAPVLEYYHDKDTYICVPICERSLQSD